MFYCVLFLKIIYLCYFVVENDEKLKYICMPLLHNCKLRFSYQVFEI